MYFLENEIIGLRQLCAKDIEGNYKNWLNDSEVCKYNNHHRFAMSEDSLQKYIESIQNSKSTMVFAVIHKEKQEHIGNVSLSSIDYINGNAELAAIIGEKEYWGQGYTTMAFELLIEQAFKELRLERLYYGTSSDNKGPQRFAEKLGFQCEGVRRKAIYKNGEYKDIIEFGLLKEEWINRGKN